MRDRRQRALRRVGVVHHVPDHSVRNGNVFGGAIHAEGDGVSASQGRGHAAADPSQAEVVAQHRDARFAHAANNGFDFFDLLRPLRAVEKNVVPVRGIEILDRRQNQARVFNLAAKIFQFLDRPKLFGIAGHSPGLIFRARRLIVARVRRALVEIVDQVDNHVSASGLAREVVVVARQHVAIKAKANFHRRLPMPAP